MSLHTIRHDCDIALILIDVINHFEFPGGDQLLRNAVPIAKRIASLKARARRAGAPTIYVNDNFGQWRSDVGKLLEYCLRPEAPGREFVDTVKPDGEDYLVLKPMHSAFYQTPLDTLLHHLKTSAVVLAGVATNSCVICTAHDANMRDIPLIVASDCCAAPSAKEHEQALDHMKVIRGARIVNSSRVRFASRAGKECD